MQRSARSAWARRFSLVLIVLSLGYTIGAGVMVWLMLREDDPSWTGLVGLVTASIALVSLIISSISSERQSRRQHTVAVIFDSRFNNELYARYVVSYRQATAGLAAPFPLQKLASIETEHGKAIDDARFLLNFFEFIAAGVITGDLDEGLVRKVLRGPVCGLVEQLRDAIGDARRNGDARTYEYLVCLYEDFADSRSPDSLQAKQRTLALIGGPPTFLSPEDDTNWRVRYLS